MKTPATGETADGGPALFRLVRFWSRRWITRTAAEVTGEMRHVQHILVVEAVAAADEHVDEHAEEPTIATVAYQLGLDHSGASRMVRDATAAGYLTRAISQRDRRRTVLALTPEGQALLAGSRQWQRQAFDQLTADWTENDRRQFASYLQRLARQLDQS